MAANRVLIARCRRECALRHLCSPSPFARTWATRGEGMEKVDPKEGSRERRAVPGEKGGESDGPLERPHALICYVSAHVARGSIVWDTSQAHQRPVVCECGAVGPDKNVLAHFELAPLDKHRPLDVLLHDVAVAARDVLLNDGASIAVKEGC